MRRNLLLVVLVFSMVLFFSRLGAANSVTIAPPTPAALQIHPCIGGGAIELDISIVTTEVNIVAVVVPIKVTGTAGAVLDTVLTGGLLSANPPAFAVPSIVSAFTQRIVNPYGIGGYGLIEPLLFVAVDFGAGLATPTSGLFAKMFYNVTGPGTVIIDTMTHSTGGGLGMNNPGGATTVSWGGPYTFNVTRTPIVAPVMNCPGLQDKFVNDVIDIHITTTPGNTPLVSFTTPSAPCGSSVTTGTAGDFHYIWNTAGCLGSTGSLHFVVYSQCDSVYCDVPYKLTASAVFVKIGCITGNPGDLVDLPVLIKPTKELGGFDLYIEFDPTLLYFKGITWKLPATFEYKTYRQLPCPMCGCCKYKLELLGLYDIKNLTQGVPLQPSDQFYEIASLDFQIAADQNLRGFDLNVCFEFDDGICTENTFSDPTGNVLYVSDNPAFFNYVDCDTQNDANKNLVLNLATFQLFAPPCTVNPLGRPCGGVFVPTTAEKVRGDVNLNLIAYDVGDAVLFSSYFIYGTNVFILDKPVQIAVTDINADGYPLGLSDFVLMLRIMAHDATPIPKPTPGSDLATIYMIGDKVSTNANLGAALFVFEGDVKVSTDLKNEQGVVNNQTRVLVYMNSNTGITGQLLTAKGKLVSVEAVDNFSRPVKTTVVNRAIPTAYALNANYPNPFNPTTNISFALPLDSKVSLKIYNIAGQLVRTLVNETMVAGTHTVTWDGINSNGEKVASGIYFYKLNAGDYSKTMKMVMTK